MSYLKTFFTQQINSADNSRIVQSESGPAFHNQDCPIEDLLILPKEDTLKNFLNFIQLTSDINETQTILSQIDKSVKLDLKHWPTFNEAQILFQKNLQLIRIKNLSQKSDDSRNRCKKWSEVDKQLFFWVAIRYCLYVNKQTNQLCPEDWREISKLIVGRNAHQCRAKWNQKLKSTLAQAPWTPNEDQELKEVQKQIQSIQKILQREFAKQGKANKWSQIAKEVFQRSNSGVQRQAKQVRERWINKLDPKISNEPWSRELELDLMKQIMVRGKRWSELSKYFCFQRSENFLKNRYHILIKREKRCQQLDRIDPKLFSQIQEIRMQFSCQNSIPLEEIDHYEWQYIVLAMMRLEGEIQQVTGSILTMTSEKFEDKIKPKKECKFEIAKIFQVEKKQVKNLKWQLINLKKLKIIEQGLALIDLPIPQSNFIGRPVNEDQVISNTGFQIFPNFQAPPFTHHIYQSHIISQQESLVPTFMQQPFQMFGPPNQGFVPNCFPQMFHVPRCDVKLEDQSIPNFSQFGITPQSSQLSTNGQTTPIINYPSPGFSMQQLSNLTILIRMPLTVNAQQMNQQQIQLSPFRQIY